MNNLKITIIQSNLHWENKAENLQMFSQKINALSEAADLIILPEMFTTGFSMSPEKFAEPMEGVTMNWMRDKAAEKKCVITGSFIALDNGRYFNRLVWMRPDGTCSTYDKRHLFRMGDENGQYNGGQKKLIVELNGWKICPLICYDLRFPVWSRNKLIPGGILQTENMQYQYEYDLLIYVANWPEIRSYPWKTLLPARAIENQCYTAGLNRVGIDGNGIYHSGNSAVINAKGEIISKINAHEEAAETITLNYDDLVSFRKLFPAILDADNFEIKND